MAFNGSGTYNLPAGNPVVTGTTISSTWANTTLSDVATALTNCVTRDGQSPATANLPLGGFKLTNVGQASATGDALAWGRNASVSGLVIGALSGLLKGATGTVSAAVSGTDYAPATSGSSILAGNAAGGFANVTLGGTLTYAGGTLSDNVSNFPAGTAMLFAQTAAPTGWTKSTTHNDKALRVVSGTASSGGSVAFSTAFANGNTGAYTLATADIPSHTHSVYICGFSAGSTYAGASQANPSVNVTSSATGGGGSHSHSLSLAVQYVDVIIATKN